jgi:hypothetical protein
MAGKLILPSEVKVCATCSYWDGERSVDPDIKVVVVDSEVEGECLVHAQKMQALWDTRQDPDCLWEDLNPDEPASQD